MIAKIQTEQLNGDSVWSLPINALPTSANGWPLRPFQIVSLLEMLKAYGHLFYLMAALLKTTIVGVDAATNKNAPLSADVKQDLLKSFDSIRKLYDQVRFR